MSFSDLGLSAELLHAIAHQGYTSPTPVQRQAIPLVLKGRDVLVGAQTGTGKTAGFTLPLLHRLQSRTSKAGESRSSIAPRSKTPQKRSSRAISYQAGTKSPRALILTPTRELAAQVSDSVKAYGHFLSLKSAVIFGGVSIRPQISALRRGVDIVVATPGRLLDHLSQGTLDLSHIEILVLDEADRMLDMGFVHDIRKVVQAVPSDRQTLLFSATFSKEIRALAQDFLDHPEEVQIARRNTAAESVDQQVILVDQKRKRELLSFMIGSQNWQQVLVFTRTKHRANRLVQQLKLDGLNSAAIHGNKSQNARTKALSQFKEGKVQVLVATDIAARGLDIQQLPYVVNYELPHVPEDYVHRIGRTGRAGNEGLAVSLVCGDEKKLLRDIERLLKRKIDQAIWQGYEPTPETRSRQSEQPNERTGRSSGGSRGRSQSGASKSGSSRGPKGRRSANRSAQQSAHASSNGSSKKRYGQSTGKSTSPKVSTESGLEPSSPQRRRRRSKGTAPERSAAEMSGPRQPRSERSRPGKGRSSNRPNTDRTLSKHSGSRASNGTRAKASRSRRSSNRSVSP